MDIQGKNNTVIINPGCYFSNVHIYVHGNNNSIIIGEHCIANSAEFWVEDDNNSINVGCNTRFAGKIHIACIEGKTVKIGKDCLFSSEVVIRTGDSHSILNLNNKRINPSENVEIGNHVWIGNRAIILKGVTVPNDCVIGTGAILTKRFSENNTIIAGIPAEIIKQDINWNVKRISV